MTMLNYCLQLDVTFEVSEEDANQALIDPEEVLEKYFGCTESIKNTVAAFAAFMNDGKCTVHVSQRMDCAATSSSDVPFSEGTIVPKE